MEDLIYKLKDGLDYLTGKSKEERLLKYCKDGSTEKVERYLGVGANPNVADENGNTPLHFAIQKGFAEIVRLLIDNGADVNKRNKNGTSPLNIIYENKYWALLNEPLDKHGNTALMLAAMHGRPNVAKKLLEEKIDYTLHNDNDKTAFKLALKKKHKFTANVIRKNISDTISVKKHTTVWKQVPVEKQKTVTVQEKRPVYRTELETYQELVSAYVYTPEGPKLQAGYLPKTRNIEVFDHYEYVPVEKKVPYTVMEKRAFREQRWEESKAYDKKELFSSNKARIKEILSWGVNPDCLDNNGETPLHYAIKKNNMDIAKMLVRYRANYNVINNKGQTPLHVAIENGSKFSEYLLMKGASVNNIDFNGETPLHYAVKQGNKNAISLLIKFGAKSDIKSKNGKTSYDYASNEIKKLIREVQKNPQAKKPMNKIATCQFV